MEGARSTGEACNGGAPMILSIDGVTCRSLDVLVSMMIVSPDKGHYGLASHCTFLTTCIFYGAAAVGVD